MFEYSTTVLAIDPGQTTGLALLGRGKGKDKKSFVYTTGAIQEEDLEKALGVVFAKRCPYYVVVEEPAPQGDGQTRGIYSRAMSWLQNYDTRILTPFASEWKTYAKIQQWDKRFLATPHEQDAFTMARWLFATSIGVQIKEIIWLNDPWQFWDLALVESLLLLPAFKTQL